MKWLSLIILFVLFAFPAFAQHEHHGNEKQAVLLPGLGALHHKVSTTNPEAQKFFDQGLSLVYAFNHEEAALSFRHAAELDPQLAMAYWGIAEAVAPNYNQDIDPEHEKIGYEAIQKAVAIANQPNVKITAAERAYIDAMAKRYSNNPKADLKKLALEYKLAMGAVNKKFPADLDAATLYAESMMNLKPWQLWSNDGKPAEGTEEIVAVIESVLKRDPKHIGAIHYYIHTVEASPYPERALAYAPYLPKLTPGAGHLVHMPAHIYIRTGDYDAAAKSNIDAAAADETYIKNRGAEGIYPLMYYNHNLDFLQAALAMNGQYKEAMDAGQRVETNVGPVVKEMAMLEPFLATRLRIMARFHKWDEILQIPEPNKAFTETTLIWHFARASALAATGKIDQAESEVSAFGAGLKTIPVDLSWGNNRAVAVLGFLQVVLDARIAQGKHDTKSAMELYNKAITMEDALIYDEPPAWNEPTRECLGALLYQTGNYAAAEKTFRDDLSKHPHSGRSLFGLAESLKAQDKRGEAAKVQKEFETAWKKADTKLRMEDL
jgi:tetratricopeptide (TPR) repeat protein